MIIHLKLVIQFSFEIITLVKFRRNQDLHVSLCVKLQDSRIRWCHVDQVRYRSVSVPLVPKVADSTVVTVPVASEQVTMEPIQESSPEIGVAELEQLTETPCSGPEPEANAL